MPWLAYAHPAAMLAVLALGVVVLREGLLIRRARFGGPPCDPARHRRLARVFVALVVIGFASGLGSQAGLRGKPLFESVHVIFATGALCGLSSAGALGLWMERHGGGPRLRLTHILLGAGGLLLGLGAAVAGIAILP